MHDVDPHRRQPQHQRDLQRRHCYLGSASSSTLRQVVLGPPVAVAGSAKHVRSKATTTVDGSGSSDPQQQPLTYSWTQIGGPPAVIVDPDEAKTAVSVPAGPGDVTLRLTVTDSWVSPARATS